MSRGVPMGLFRKKTDPLNDRAEALNSKIAKLEAEIAQLSSGLSSAPTAEPPAPLSSPRRTSTPVQTPTRPEPAPLPTPTPSEPVFERVDQKRVMSEELPPADPGLYNDLGVRKYDLISMWKRLASNFTTPPANNARLVNYLAAGSIQGLRPLRYEKRVARNRLLALAGALLLLLWGIIYVAVKR